MFISKSNVVLILCFRNVTHTLNSKFLDLRCDVGVAKGVRSNAVNEING